MKKTTAIAMFLAVAAGTASAGAAITLSGSDTLEVVTKRIIATCPASIGTLAGITYGGGGSSTGETAMKNGTQQVSPMSRYYSSTSTSGACGANQAKAEGLEIAGDGLAMLASAAASAQCQGAVDSTGGLARNTTVTVQNPPGADTNYTFADWKDVLRTLYAGRDNTKPNTVPADCNSNVRKSLQKSWSKLFQASCGATPCTELKHAWRRGDLSGTTDTFLTLTSLPGIARSGNVVTATPFCNGKDYDDNDPIRIACDANDDVCGADGKMGLVQSVFVPEGLATDVAYPVKACDPGVYNWVPAPNVTLDTCPGGGVNVFTLCLMPGWNDATQVPSGINHSCVKREKDDAPFFTPNTTNTLVYNQYLRNPNGSLIKDAENREVTGAWYRMRSRALTGCRQDTATLQIGCLASQYNCTLGFAGQEAIQAGAAGLVVNGVTSTNATVLNRTYPLARGLFFNSIKGFENVTNTNNELNLSLCFGDNATTNAAAAFAGFVPVNAVDPTAKIKCVDFNETVCGAASNVNACTNNPVGIAPN